MQGGAEKLATVQCVSEICHSRSVLTHTLQTLSPTVTDTGLWRGCLSGTRCRLAYGPAHPGSPGQRAVKRVCVCDNNLKMKLPVTTLTYVKPDVILPCENVLLGVFLPPHG